MCYASAPANSRSSGLAARHAPIDRFIARRKVALLISGAFPHLVARHAGPNPGDFFNAGLLVFGNNHVIAPRANLGGGSTHKLAHVDDEAFGAMLKRGFRKDAQIFFEVLVGHPLRPGKPSQLDDAFRLKMIDGNRHARLVP